MILNGIERRILAYLDQRGGQAKRIDIVADLSSPDSRIGRGILNGSNAGVPRLFGAWARRLLKEGLVIQKSTPGYGRHPSGFYSHHEITDAGRAKLREAA